MRHILQNLCLSIIGLLLLGYVLAGKGFAYIGVPPIYVSEIVLALSMALFFLAPDIRIFFRSKIIWLIILLDVWCFAQTLPYIEKYGIESLRDATIYGYSIFAFIIASYMFRRGQLAKLVTVYDRAISVCVVLLPVMIALMPRDLDTLGEVPFVLLKHGDVAVHLAGALAFRLLGVGEAVALERGRVRLLPNWLFWLAWLASCLWVLSASRGGMLALIAGALVIAVFGYGRRYMVGVATAVVVVLATMAVFDVRIDTERREISAAQIVSNATSIVLGSGFDGIAPGIDTVDLESTAMWRLLWWEEIIDYVVFGDYFWSGKGFGVNIADSDGYQAGQDGELRSPHNGHLTILARAGVPGLIFWLMVQGAFAVALIGMAIRMSRNRAVAWHRLSLWVLAYWGAATVNASFDVYLEGPQGGIWYWSIIGVGLAVLAEGRKPIADHEVVAAGPTGVRAVP